jgi:hypothetical protein
VSYRKKGILFFQGNENISPRGQAGKFKKVTVNLSNFLTQILSFCFLDNRCQSPFMSFPKVSPAKKDHLDKARGELQSKREAQEGPLFTTNAPNVPYGIGPDSPWFEVKEGPRERIKKRIFEPEEHIRDKSKRRRLDSASILPQQKPEPPDLNLLLELDIGIGIGYFARDRGRRGRKLF